MKEWNVVVTVFQEGYRRAFRALGEIGPVAHSPYHNVLVMAVEDPLAFLDHLERRTQADPALYDAISRVAPAMRCFEFHSIDEFKAGMQSILMEWMPRMGGRSFHVRLRRRGFEHDWASPDVERFFDDWVLDALKEAGTPGSVSFSDPDAVFAVDTIDDRAGISLWTREDLAGHHLLRPD